MDYERDRGLETALFRCSQRDSAQSFFSLLFFSVMHLSLSSDAARKASGLMLQALRGELRTLDQRPNSPSLFTLLLFFLFFLVTHFVLRRGLDTPATLFFSLSLSLFHFLLFASLPRFRRYLRETKGFSSRYTETGSGLLNPPLAAFSFSRMIFEKINAVPFSCSKSRAFIHLRSSYGILIPL